MLTKKQTLNFTISFLKLPYFDDSKNKQVENINDKLYLVPFWILQPKKYALIALMVRSHFLDVCAV